MRRWALGSVCLALLAAAGALTPHAPFAASLGRALRVDGDFPGGNVVIERVDGDTVLLHHDQRDTPAPWFYWCFRVRGAAGRTLTFRFTRGDVLGVLGPAVSTDGGRSWGWLGRGAVDGPSFRYAFPPDAAEVRFSFGIPYLEQDLRAYLARHAGSPHLRRDTLCRTSRGREVDLLRAGRLDGGCDRRVLLTARHHACEAMADYALEGLLDVVLGGGADGRWLRGHVEFLVVPFMDKDGVEAGDQGKLRRPHDHWEDYAGASRYPEVRALRAYVPRWSEGRLRLALDVHCPARLDQAIYFAGPRRPPTAAALDRLAADLAATPAGVLAYRPADNMPFGRGWNTAAYYGTRKNFALWAEELPGVRAAGVLEIPYARVGVEPVTPAAVRAFGGRLAAALRRFLEREP